MIIKAPFPVPILGQPDIFLAGTIEMGAGEDWQARVGAELEDKFLVLNPRRDDWDSTWEQTIDNPNFHEQVKWELDGIDSVDFIFFYFQPGTKSPISLLELGLAIGTDASIVVVCPEGFWRKGNVDIVCETYSGKLTQFDTIEQAVEYLRNL